jgi:two-component system phosphate regulon sensor histidine kinase PhoR
MPEPEDWSSQYERLQSQVATLKAKLGFVETECSRLQQENRRLTDDDLSRLQKENQELRRRLDEAANTAAPQPVTSASEFDETLRRLVARVAMIVQAEKCVFLLLNREDGHLYAMPPAFGFKDEELHRFKVRSTEGVSGLVFRTGRPETRSLESTPELGQEFPEAAGVRNLLTVPLIIEKRDDQGHVTDRMTIGVLHVINKRYGASFTEEDSKLLAVLSRNAAAVIAQAQLFQQVEERVREVEATIESSPFGVLMVNMNGAITQMNASVRHMLQLGHNTLGQPYERVIKDETIREALTAALRESEESQHDVRFVVDVNGTQMEHFHQMQIALVKGESQETLGALAAFHDITEVKRIEQMKSAFVSSVSHELRTPMTAIQGFVQTLLDDPDEEFYDRDMRQEFLTIIGQECQRLLRMISNLLNVSRIETGRPVEYNFQPGVDLGQLVTKTIAFQQPYATRHTLVPDVPEDLPTITADVDKVDQVLTNLMSNAIKYAPDGGEVRLTVRDVPEKRLLRVSVKDQGLGIPPDQLHKVFAKYQRVESAGHKSIAGTGLGLFIVKEYVEKHGGKIWVESEVGKGSDFIFELPYEPPTIQEPAG